MLFMNSLEVLLFVIFLGNHGVLSAKRVDLQKRMAATMKHYDNVVARRSLKGEHPSTKQMLGLRNGEDLVKVRSITTVKGETKTKYQETFKGIPVIGEGVVLSKKHNGAWTGEASGQLVEGIANDVRSVQPRLSKQEALEVSLATAQLTVPDVSYDEDTDINLEISIDNKENDPRVVSARLVYVVAYVTETPHGLSRPHYTIDANTGEVLNMWEGINISPFDEETFTDQEDFGRESVMSKRSEHTSAAEPTGNGEGKMVYITSDGGNVRRGRHTYGKEYKKLLVTQIGDTCYMTNDKVEVIDFSLCNYTYNRLRTNNKTYSFNCYDGNHDFANGAFSPSNDAYYYALECYNMYNEWYNTKPLKFKIKVMVHYAKYPNAMWDGRRIIFLDGNSRIFPLTEPSIVAHELSHGFTQQNSNLLYYSQHGGINEAFSDMSGETLEYYLDKKTDYMIGGRLSKKGDWSLRYMEDPSMDNRSLSSYDDYCGDINVHFSSGIFNRAFYLLSKVRGWGPRKAFHPFVVANQMYWREKSGFHDAACGVLKATRDLGYDEDDVSSVFRKVGVIPCLAGINSEIKGIGDLKVVGKGEQHFVWRSIAGAKSARISLTGGKGDVNMVVKYGSRYNHNEGLQLKTAHIGADQIVEFPNPKEGKYFITLFTSSGYEDARIDLSYDYSSILKDLTNEHLVENITRVRSYRSNNYTSVYRIYSLKHISMHDFISFKSKSTSGWVLLALFEGERKRGEKFGRPVAYGWNKIRLCAIKAKQYHLVALQTLVNVGKVDDSQLVPVHGFSGTRLQWDKSNGC